MNKSKYNSRTSLSNKSVIIENPTKIDICKDNIGVSVLSGNGENLSSITPDQQRIPRKNKIKKPSYTFITRKKIIQEPVNPSKCLNMILYLF